MSKGDENVHAEKEIIKLKVIVILKLQKKCRIVGITLKVENFAGNKFRGSKKIKNYCVFIL